MKQKIIIGFSIVLFLLAVYLIARDLFHHSPAMTGTYCCDDDFSDLKRIDTADVGYTIIRTIETGLKNLTGIAVNEHQQIFTCGNRQVDVFNPAGDRIGEFRIDSMASCIAVEGEDVFVGMGPRIAHYNTDGVKLSLWASFNDQGYITSVAVNEEFVYAADAISKRILKYNKTGQLIMEIGKKDSLADVTGFIIPSLYFDVAFGGFNDMWVANTGRLRIENYNTKGIIQSFWGKISPENRGFSGCCNPVHIALLPDGNFVTYEKGLDKIKIFDPTGNFLCLVGGAGSFKGQADFLLGRNNLVKDIATGSNGNVYVLDAYNRINIFRKKDL